MFDEMLRKVREKLKDLLCGCCKKSKPKLVVSPEVENIIQRGTKGSVGFDLPALKVVKCSTGELEFPISLYENDWILLDTGLKWEASDEGEMLYELQVRPRSGFSTKNGIIVTNTPGTIDPDYRGNIMVHLTKITDGRVDINKFDRVAQAVISKVLVAPDVVISETTETKTTRGTGGFGHTGK